MSDTSYKDQMAPESRAASPSGTSGDTTGGTKGGNMAQYRKWLPLAMVVVLMAAAFSLGLHEHVSLSALISERQALASYVSSNLALSILIYVSLYFVVVALSLPGALVLSIAGGFLFGWLISGFATLVGATIGATAIFMVARSSFGELLTRRAGPFLKRLTEGFQEDAFNYLLFLRLTPVFPFWLVNIAPAMFNMRLSSYVFATAIGIVPGTFAFAFIGSGLDSLIAAQELADPGCAAAGTCHIDFSALITPQIFAAFVALGVASLIPVVMKRLRARKS